MGTPGNPGNSLTVTEMDENLTGQQIIFCFTSSGGGGSSGFGRCRGPDCSLYENVLGSRGEKEEES